MGPALAIIAAQRGRNERELLRQLRERDALSPETATALNPTRPMERAVLRNLVRSDVVMPIEPDRYWLDEAAYSRMRARRGRIVRWTIVFLLLSAAATVAAVLLLEPTYVGAPT